ncbi:hypothetical protein E1J29_13425 [Xanthomonas hortorum pv. vitians]|nr:hypothetical protein [Xanthomonas hortorum pv. vitians]QEW15851.1 hypothetical protein DYQ48_13650 [Xanthomonas hortorum]NMI27740.1 hypothetical protein [Xanthomonas hortorum pv. vitians]NMI31384.1 hypothetical protein [Xanthomonas hortorum pv. vitians]NMI36435.1 hypothetical protein [Xanthomonas hortorum pv. vitians]
MRATGARGLERPRSKRGPGRGAGVGVRVRGEALVVSTARGFARTLIRRCAPPSPGRRRNKARVIPNRQQKSGPKPAFSSCITQVMH